MHAHFRVNVSAITRQLPPHQREVFKQLLTERLRPARQRSRIMSALGGSGHATPGRWLGLTPSGHKPGRNSASQRIREPTAWTLLTAPRSSLRRWAAIGATQRLTTPYSYGLACTAAGAAWLSPISATKAPTT
jgi:hypothetical protein